MDPLELLQEEHRQIGVVISAITALLDHTNGDRRISPAPFLELQQFIFQFADGSHHSKEEQVLFFEMAEAGMSTDSGPLASMMHEHEDSRKYAAVMGAAARACLEGQWHRQVEMVASARAWCALLTLHMEKEDTEVFPAAKQVMGARLAKLPALFAKVDPSAASAFEGAARAVVAAAEQAAQRRRPTG